MENIFIQPLKFDFDVSDSFINDLSPRVQNINTSFYTSDYKPDTKVVDFLRGLNLMVKRVDVGIAAANTYAGDYNGIPIHRDGAHRHFDNGVLTTSSESKLLWVFGGPKREMLWFIEDENHKDKAYKFAGVNGSDAKTGDAMPREFCKLVYSSPLTGPSLVSVDYLHSVDNLNDEPLWFLSYSLGNLETKKFVSWQDARVIFEPYFA